MTARYFLIGSFLIFLSSCSGGGSGSSGDSGSSSSGGALDVAAIATAAVQTTHNATFASIFSASFLDGFLNEQLLEESTQKAETNLPPEVISSICNDGTQTINTTLVTPDDGNDFPVNIIVTTRYDDYCELGEVGTNNVILDGQVITEITLNDIVLGDELDSADFDLDFTFVAADDDGVVIGKAESVNATVKCSIADSFGGSSCDELSAEYQGSTLNVTNLDAQFAGIILDGQLDSQGQDNTVSAQSIAFCEDLEDLAQGEFDIQLPDDSVINVLIPACGEMTVTYQGVAESLEQP